MSTRCNIHFCDGKNVEANIYRHCDGYPEGVNPDLQRFFAEVEKQTTDTRFQDPAYLAAKFVVWQAGENVACNQKWTPDKPIGPLNFISLGVMAKDAGDGEYVYKVDCSKLDSKGRPTVTHRDVRP